MDARTDAALRPQPRREGPDLWGTPATLIDALVGDVLPQLSATGRIWEPACGDGRLAERLRTAGRSVVATDYPALDFLQDPPPPGEVFAAIATNPPFNALDQFIRRGLRLLDGGVTRSLTLLLRLDHLPAQRRVGPISRAAEIRLCAWRPRWIEGSTTGPRWSFAWITWKADHQGPPSFAYSVRPLPLFVAADRTEHVSPPAEAAP